MPRIGSCKLPSKLAICLCWPKPMCRRIFADDIRMFFNANNIRYVEGAQFRGKSGLLCPYDFVLPFTNKQPERFCTSITRPSQRLISSTLFSWEDTQSARKTPSELVVFLNDSDRRIDNQLITALEKYNAYPIKWSEREFKENLYKLASRVVLVALVGSEVSAVCCVDLPSVAYGDSSPQRGERRHIYAVFSCPILITSPHSSSVTQQLVSYA